ncbi:MAG: cysteine desulfurase family protein [Methylomicrobium sp.]
MIYLDHNATTPLDERVVETMLPFLQSYYGNASALYRLGRLSRSAVETAREQVGALVGVPPSQVVFTSGGTESNNLAVHAAAGRSRILISRIEHPSVTEPAERLQAAGCNVYWLEVDRRGLFDPEAFERCLAKRPEFASLMLANNETGVVQRIADFASALRECGAIVHTDAVQAAGKIPVAFERLNVQMMSLSGHKIYGPKGSGALIVEKGFDLDPLLLGGGQEKGYRAGTENVAAIVGFGKAAELALSELTARRQKMFDLSVALEQGLTELGAVIFGREAERLPNTVQFGFDGVDGEMLLMQLDRQGFAVSSGSACASGGGMPSPVLVAMGVEAGLAKSAIRVSFGQFNTEADVVRFLQCIKPLTTGT